MEYDEAIACKDKEIRALRLRVDALEARPETEPLARVTHRGSVSVPDAGPGGRAVPVVPVSDPGRNPTHPLPAASPHGGGRVGARPTESGAATLRETTGSTAPMSCETVSAASVPVSLSHRPVYCARGARAGAKRHQWTRLMGSRPTYSSKTGCQRYSEQQSGTSGVRARRLFS